MSISEFSEALKKAKTLKEKSELILKSKKNGNIVQEKTKPN